MIREKIASGSLLLVLLLTAIIIVFIVYMRGGFFSKSIIMQEEKETIKADLNDLQKNNDEYNNQLKNVLELE